jgi:hypothetical protein
MSLDLTKPLRLRSDGRSVTLICVIEDEESGVRLSQALPAMAVRYEGQTVLCKLVNEEGITRYRWFYPSGGFITRDDRALENVPPPPVVVKSRREVMYHPTAADPITTRRIRAGVRQPIGLIEFTVTDGKLTNVEIVE